ncbi:hypothetical protein DLM49_08605 [Streptomyces sp. WAC 01438]|nr:hypothetical protein DLM49_08605 [Streptomyces sp. WAC 01438]
MRHGSFPSRRAVPRAPEVGSAHPGRQRAGRFATLAQFPAPLRWVSPAAWGCQVARPAFEDEARSGPTRGSGGAAPGDGTGRGGGGDGTVFRTPRHVRHRAP